MPDKSTVRVDPPSLLASADSAGQILDEAAAHPGRTSSAHSDRSSASDLAGAAVAAAMSARAAALAAAGAGAGPAVETTTAVGVAQLQAQDEQNAEALRAVAQQDSQWV